MRPTPHSLPLVLLLSLLLPAAGRAHPNPDIPVRTHFSEGGAVEVRVEVDPRAFKDDPEAYDYFTKTIVEALSPEQVRSLTEAADQFVATRLRFFLEPRGEATPSFTWSFGKLGDLGPLREAHDPAVLVGSWRPEAGSTSSYRVEALKLASETIVPMNVVFVNHYRGHRLDRYAVLFPGETSFQLDLASLPTQPLAKTAEAPPLEVAPAQAAAANPVPPDPNQAAKAAVPQAAPAPAN